MSSQPTPFNAYTDAPTLHANLILGSLQLLAWLLFHPSAWRNHIAGLDPNLSPDFSFVDLSRSQIHNPGIQRLLIIEYIAWPIPIALLVGISLWIFGASTQNVIIGIIASQTAFVVSSVVGSLLLGVAVTFVGNLAIPLAAGMTTGLLETANHDIQYLTIMGMTFSIMFGFFGSIIGRLPTTFIKHKPAFSLYPQVGGIVISLIVGIMTIFITNYLTGGIVLGITEGVVVDVENSLKIGLISGVVSGIAIGIITRNWRYSIGLAFATGFLSDLTFFLTGIYNKNILNGVTIGILFAIVFGGLTYAVAKRIAGSSAGSFAGVLVVSGSWITILIFPSEASFWPVLLLSLLSILFGWTLALWLPMVLYPIQLLWNRFLYHADKQRSDEQPSLLRWHSAFWDEFQRWRLYGLDDHLLLVAGRNPAEYQMAINYLSTSPQRWAAQAAQIELEARGLERVTNLEEMARVHHHLTITQLEGEVNAILREFSRHSQNVEVALSQIMLYHKRLSLKKTEEKLDHFGRELIRSSDRYSVRFHPIVIYWHQLVSEQLNELAKAIELSQEIENPYVIGVPLSQQQEIFVGRTDISAHLEQLLLDRRRPPLLLYGQRRMGKTSLLRNLGYLLPTSIVPLFVDGEGSSGATDYPDLLYNISWSMRKSAKRQRGVALPRLDRQQLAANPFTSFKEWLDQVEQVLESKGQSVALLALDEFEALNDVMDKGRFDEADVFRLLRHIIQHRPRFKVLLAGSHTLDEFQSWASYLINVQVVKISYLKEYEARQLIEKPIKDFPLRYEADATQQILALTRGHPQLVQSLCYQIVMLKNQQLPAKRRLVTLADVKAAVPMVFSHGSMFFTEIKDQLDDKALELLITIATAGEAQPVTREVLARQFTGDLETSLSNLLQRDLIEKVGTDYHFQVELIRRWFLKQS